MRTKRVHSSFLLLLSLSAVLLYGQSRSSTILGTVSDSSGAVIPGATVTVVEQSTNSTRVVTTDSTGRYLVTLLPVGNYTVKATAPGFKEVELKDVLLELQENREANFTLYPTGVETTVEVSAQAVEIERTTSSLGQVIHEQTVAQLPLNGRNFVQLATLVPGAAKGEGGFFNSRSGEVSVRGSMSLSVQGMRENSNDWLIDGVDNNELTAGGIAILPSIDAIKEFKVLTYNYSAEYGSRGGATVLVNTKGGTNAFHGTLFEFLRNDHLDAANFFENASGLKKAKYNQNQFGGSVGGPIKKDKTFFFGDYQRTSVRQGLTFLAQVPTAAMVNGDFNESFPGAARTIIYNPATTRTDPATGRQVRDPFPGNKIPSGSFDPIAVKLLALFPLPNRTDRLAGNYVSNPVREFDQHSFNTRIDHTFSEKDSFFGRFSFDHALQNMPSGLPGFGSGPGAFTSTTHITNEARSAALSETHIFSPRTVNQVTVGFNRIFNFMNSIGTGLNKARELGIPGANLGDFLTSGLTNIGFSGGYWRLGDRGFTPFIGGTNIYHVFDNVSHVRGRHNLKGGFSFRAMQMNLLGAPFPHGRFDFNNLFTAGFTAAGTLDAGTGQPIASMLLGLPTTGQRANKFAGTSTGRRWKEYRGYFEDSWQVTSNLNVILGLAYDLTTPITEQHDRQTNFDFATGKFLVPGANAGGSAGVATDTNDFQPRFGFAWSPRGSKTTAVRGGYGIFHDVSWNLGSPGLWSNPPFFAQYAFSADNISAVRTLATGFPSVPQPTVENASGDIVSTQRDLRHGLVQQWNLNIQRELPASFILTAAYAGSRANGLTGMNYLLNTATPGSGFNPAARRPYPQFNTINGILSRGDLIYHSLQIKGEKRMSRGFYALVSYTWSKALSNSLPNDVGGTVGVTYFPVAAWKNADKALTNTDLRHSFTMSYLYDLPFGRGRTFLSSMGPVGQAVLGNWGINGITRLRTGFPLGMSMNVNQNGTALGNRPNRVCNGELPSGQQTVDRFFDTSCFVAPPAGVLGNAARTTLSGPGQVNFDFSAFKTFPIRESMDLQFRAEFFNIFNTAQFAQPGTVIGAATAARIQSTINLPRLIQFALKLRF